MLKIENLQVRYGKVRAVNGVDMSVEKGEIVALIGANGAGKTTLLRAISGLNKPTAGSVALEGENITKMAPEAINLRGLAHVPEGRRLFGQMSVLDNLELGAFQRTDKAEIKNNLERIYEHFPDLTRRLKQMAGSLSGGQQQMVAIGRAMMSSPKVILMDEPSLGLSPVMCQEIARIIRQINQNGVTILLVEQNARLALALARHGFVMETGRIVMKGDADQMQSDPKVQEAYLGIA